MGLPLITSRVPGVRSATQMVQDCEGIVPAHVDPEIAFQKGDRDAKSILWMRCLRTFTLVLFAVGGIIAVLAHRFDEHLSDDLKTPLGLAHSLTTPLAVLAIAVGLRVLVTVLAYLLAFRAVSANRATIAGSQQQTRLRRAVDQWRLAGAFRSLRWSWAARDVAIKRLGSTGVRLARLDAGLRITGVCFAFLFIVVAYSRSA